MMVLSQNIGYLAACYNQYMIFINEHMPSDGKEIQIGFKALNDNIKEKKNGE